MDTYRQTAHLAFASRRPRGVVSSARDEVKCYSKHDSTEPHFEKTTPSGGVCRRSINKCAGGAVRLISLARVLRNPFIVGGIGTIRILRVTHALIEICSRFVADDVSTVRARQEWDRKEI
jgi:hypothetical protein